MLLAFALGAPLALVLPCAVAAGVGLALFGVWWETALAQRIPPAALSRVASYDWMGSFALLPPGLVLIGVLAEAASATTVMAIAGASASLLVLIALLPRETRGLRRLADGADAAAALGRDARVPPATHCPERAQVDGADASAGR